MTVSQSEIRPMPGLDADVQDWIDWSLDRLETHERYIACDPQTNSVKQLAFDLSSALEEGTITQAILNGIIRRLTNKSLLTRIDSFRDFHRPQSGAASLSSVRKELQSLAQAGFKGFKRRVECHPGGLVFTAHPTFSLSESLYRLMADRTETDDPQRLAEIDEAIAAVNQLPDAEKLTLAREHDLAQSAIEQAQGAVRTLNETVLETAAEHFPDEWRTLRPKCLSIASWVGYDLDGRTDIHWSHSIHLRLREKAIQLDRYRRSADRLAATTGDSTLQSVANLLSACERCTEADADAFDGDLSDADAMVKAANRLTDGTPERFASLQPIIQSLETCLENTKAPETARELILLISEMQTYGLGTSRIHLRINASQMRSVILAELGIDPEASPFNRLALEGAVEKTQAAQRKRVNFANLYKETMTARRQFMLCAQLFKHVDADTPIRFLIAECEHPATVMGAVYLARLYDVADRMDISPLFETPEALERGGRFMERLFDEPQYIDYARQRGRIAIQIGFSDSGRFMGQVPAGLAAERLQILVARALGRKGIRDIDVLIFNTHGESMGRGAHPISFKERFEHLLPEWVRSRYLREGINLLHETSYQGGDGFLHFATPYLALSTAATAAAHSLSRPEYKPEDPFYADLNFTWDVYRAQKAWQENLFDNEDYRIVLGSFAPNFLIKTGSRKTRRQTGAAAGTPGPRAMRAIPHNAILQQLACPINVCGGFGTSISIDPERFLRHVEGSSRTRSVVKLAARARLLTSLPALRAYSTLFDAGFWMARSIWAKRPDVKEASRQLSERVMDQTIYAAINRLSTYLAGDLHALDRVLPRIDETLTPDKRRIFRRELHILHALRLTLTMRAFLLITRLPGISKRHDVSRDDIIDMVLSLRLGEAAAHLDDIFPDDSDDYAALKNLTEPGDETPEHSGYEDIQDRIIRPLRMLDESIKQLSVGISHYYGAYG